MKKNQQSVLIDKLLEHFRSRGQHPDLIETHISWLILTDRWAYKIKKAVNLGFLDYSTLEQRRHFCAEEIRLNGRLAPQLYLGVVAISDQQGELAFNTGNEAVEYAVLMRRFTQDSLFNHRLQAGLLSEPDIRDLAQQIADFHANIPGVDPALPYGEPDKVFEPMQENFDQIRPHVSDPQDSLYLDEVEQWSRQERQRCLPQLRARKENGFIRLCHGDLHLGNIARYENRIVIFDGIEFNPNLYWIDVISELSFCCMDLDDHRRPDLSNLLLNQYLATTGDFAATGLLRFYLVYRAMVRAKVAQIRLQQTQAAKRAALQEEFRNYLNLAHGYTRALRPALVLTYGLSGSGKTYTAEKLARRINAIHLRSDQERMRLFPEASRSGDPLYTGRYSPAATTRTYQHLAELAQLLLRNGFHTIVDATFLRQAQREPFLVLARTLGLEVIILHTVAELSCLEQRIRKRAAEKSDLSEATTQVMHAQLEHHDALSASEQNLAFPLHTDDPDALQSGLETLVRLLTTPA